MLAHHLEVDAAQKITEKLVIMMWLPVYGADNSIQKTLARASC